MNLRKFMRIYASLREFLRVCASLRESAQVCARLCESAQVYTNLREFVRICTKLLVYKRPTTLMSASVDTLILTQLWWLPPSCLLTSSGYTAGDVSNQDGGSRQKCARIKVSSLSLDSTGITTPALLAAEVPPYHSNMVDGTYAF